MRARNLWIEAALAKSGSTSPKPTRYAALIKWFAVRILDRRTTFACSLHFPLFPSSFGWREVEAHLSPVRACMCSMLSVGEACHGSKRHPASQKYPCGLKRGFLSVVSGMVRVYTTKKESSRSLGPKGNAFKPLKAGNRSR